MKKMLLMIAAVALIATPAIAKKKGYRAPPSPQETAPAYLGIPVVGTFIGSSEAFWGAPSLERSGSYVGYLVCSPFELIGARCR